MRAEILRYFSGLIEQELGIVYSEHNRYRLVNRLDEAIRLLQLKDVYELKDRVQTCSAHVARQTVLDLATNNETSFFRDPTLFAALRAHVFPAYAGLPLRIWSAACSNGQEPYSLAMSYIDRPYARQFEILATDVASHALRRAEAAKYTAAEIKRGLPAELIARYASEDPDGLWTIGAQVRSLVRFQRLNLLGAFTDLGRFDIILCRNVLIYQSVPNKIQVINSLARRLKPRGILILGAGESLLGISTQFKTVNVGGAAYYEILDAAVAV